MDHPDRRKKSGKQQGFQWKVGESLICVLSTIENKWDPYQPQKEIDVSLEQSYLDIWLRLVIVMRSWPPRRRSSRCLQKRGQIVQRKRWASLLPSHHFCIIISKTSKQTSS